MKLNASLSGILARLFLIAIGAIILITVSPALQPIPHRDSGVFLYIGRGVLLGKIPYLDFWDHKGPLIYYLNALGFLFSANSYWGVWLLEFLCLLLTILLSFALLKEKFNAQLAFIGTLLWLLALGRIFTVQFGAGNHVEEYALLFYMAQIYLFFREDTLTSTGWKYFGIGIFAGMCILLRPNLISPLFGIGIIQILSLYRTDKQDRSKFLLRLGKLAGGVSMPLLITVIYFWRKQALQPLISDVIAYNFFYTGSGTLYFSAFLNSFRILGLLIALGFAAWLLLIFFHNRMLPIASNATLAYFIILTLPAEVIFSLISGHGYIHYFIPWLPLLGLSTCLFLQTVQHFLEQIGDKLKPHLYFNAIALAIIVMQTLPLAWDLRFYYAALFNPTSVDVLLDLNGMKQLYEITPKNSPVIFWGNEVEYNFFMDLPSPSKYIYIYPFLSPAYASADMQNELLNTLKTQRPVIVDVQPSITPPLRALNKWDLYPKALPLIYYIKNNYQIVREMNIINLYHADGQDWKLTQKWIVWTHK